MIKMFTLFVYVKHELRQIETKTPISTFIESCSLVTEGASVFKK